jgi:hypothetical protein
MTKAPYGTFTMTGTFGQVQSYLQNLQSMMRRDPRGQDALVTLTVRPASYRMRAQHANMMLKHNMRNIEAVKAEALRLKNERLASKERGEEGPGPSRRNPQRSQFRHDYRDSQKGRGGGNSNTNDDGEAIITLGGHPVVDPLEAVGGIGRSTEQDDKNRGIGKGGNKKGPHPKAARDPVDTNPRWQGGPKDAAFKQATGLAPAGLGSAVEKGKGKKKRGPHPKAPRDHVDANPN